MISHDLNAWTPSLQHKRPRFVEQQLSTAFGWLKLETSSLAAKGSPWAGSPNIHIDNRTMSKVWSFLKIKLNSSTSEVPKWNQSEANLLGRVTTVPVELLCNVLMNVDDFRHSLQKLCDSDLSLETSWNHWCDSISEHKLLIDCCNAWL